MAVSAPPKKKPVSETALSKQFDEEKIDEIINRGSSTIVAVPLQQVPATIKNFNIKILSTQLSVIEELRAKRPRKPISPKLGISLQDWMIEAIEEKIRREKKQYNIN